MQVNWLIFQRNTVESPVMVDENITTTVTSGPIVQEVRQVTFTSQLCLLKSFLTAANLNISLQAICMHSCSIACSCIMALGAMGVFGDCYAV